MMREMMSVNTNQGKEYLKKKGLEREGQLLLLKLYSYNSDKYKQLYGLYIILQKLPLFVKCIKSFILFIIWLKCFIRVFRLQSPLYLVLTTQ